MIDLVIFDCDGVLVDSEMITNRIFAQMLNDLGIPISIDDMFQKFVGRSMPQCLEMIAGMLGRAVPAGFVEEYRSRTEEALRANLKPIPGIEAVLEGLAVPYCVASSGSHEKMRVTLGVTGLLAKFQGKIFSVADVARSKPFPDVFLHAASESGVPASACAVIEDSPTGVQAGVAAGMKVFGYSALTPKHRLTAAGAHCTFDNMLDLPALLNA